MKLFGRTIEGYAKALVVLVAVLSLSTGLCAVTNSVAARDHGWWNMSGAWGNFLAVASLTEAAVLVLSALGTVLVLIVWPIHAAMRRARGHRNEPWA